jgi:hydroxymethylglutaryl-CoA lyase
MFDVLISEVGPRDGLQSVKSVMPTSAKFLWLASLHASGLREIEVCSFVPAQLMPQMADAVEVVKNALQYNGLTVMALVPNLRGAQSAIEAGAHKITIPISASEAHSLANVRKSRVDMVSELKAIVALRNEIAPQVIVEVGMSTAFGCTIQGKVSESDVLWLAEQCIEAGADELGLSDTTGMANPTQVKSLFRQVRSVIGDNTGAAHMHNTRGLGLANCLAAFDEGVRTFDSSMAGLGGCPFAPGASGNVVTEDLVFMFEAMGVRTGVDIEKLFVARQVLREGLPDEPLYGMIPEAGLPKGWLS